LKSTLDQIQKFPRMKLRLCTKKLSSNIWSFLTSGQVPLHRMTTLLYDEHQLELATKNICISHYTVFVLELSHRLFRRAPLKSCSLFIVQMVSTIFDWIIYWMDNFPFKFSYFDQYLCTVTAAVVGGVLRPPLVRASASALHWRFPPSYCYLVCRVHKKIIKSRFHTHKKRAYHYFLFAL
jgi:hypothetical protein